MFLKSPPSERDAPLVYFKGRKMENFMRPERERKSDSISTT